MSRRKIEMHEYKTIIFRLKQKQSVRSIAKDGLAGRHKIKEIKTIARQQGWLENGANIPDLTELTTFFAKNSSCETRSTAISYKEEIEEWLKQGIQASTIHDHLKRNYGFTGAYNSVQRLVKKIKDAQPTELTVPLHFKVAEAAQVDFGQGPNLFDIRVKKDVKTWFFVMTLCWSRHQYAEIITHQDVETWLNCHRNAFNWFGGVVKRIIIDNAKCAITKACYNEPNVQRSYENLALEYGFIISACPPRDPKKKGRVESGVKYVKNNFAPLRQFKNLQDANQQLKTWVMSTAGNRIHGSIFEMPLTKFTDIEQNQLIALPEIIPEIAVWKKVIMYRDCHVRYLKCKYSAPYKLYEQELWLKSTPNIISIYHQHKLVAQHARKFVAGECSTKKEHLPPNARFFLEKDASWCLKRSVEIGVNCAFIIENLLTDPVRDLLRQVQSILQLSKKYSDKRLEKACQRAYAFSAGNLKTISTILKEGLDANSITTEETFEQLSDVYQGKGKFQRAASDLLH